MKNRIFVCIGMSLFLFFFFSCQPKKPLGEGEVGADASSGADVDRIVKQDLPVPVVTILSPERGAMLTGHNEIQIQGKMNLTGAQIKWLKVNGKPVTVDSNGRFTASMVAKWGVNTLFVDVLSQDGVPGYRAQSFLWSQSYRAMDGTRTKKAVVARLNQPVLDDGNRKTLNDLASILEKVFNGIDIDPLLPELLVEGKYKIPPIGPTVSYKVTKNGKVEVGRRSLKLVARKGGLSLWAKLEDLSIPVKGTAAKYLNKKAVIKAPYVELKAEILLEINEGKVTFSFETLAIDVSKVEVKAFSGIFKFLNGLVTKMIRKTLKTKLEETMKTLLPPYIKGFLTGFKLAKEMTLPPILGGKTLAFDSGIDQLVFDEKGGTIGLSVAITGGASASAKLGTPLWSQTEPVFSSTEYALGVGFAYNLVNQIFTAAWQAGVLEQDLTSLVVKKGQALPLGAKSMRIAVDALLPPLLFPSRTPGMVHVSVGDLKLKVDFEQADGTKGSLVVYVAATFRGKVQLTPNNDFSVELNTKPDVLFFDITKAYGIGLEDISPGELTTLLQPMIPQILGSLASSLLQNIPVPSFDLSVFAGQYGIPKGTNLSFKGGKLSFPKDHIFLTGDL